MLVAPRIHHLANGKEVTDFGSFDFYPPSSEQRLVFYFFFKFYPYCANCCNYSKWAIYAADKSVRVQWRNKVDSWFTNDKRVVEALRSRCKFNPSWDDFWNGIWHLFLFWKNGSQSRRILCNCSFLFNKKCQCCLRFEREQKRETEIVAKNKTKKVGNCLNNKTVSVTSIGIPTTDVVSWKEASKNKISNKIISEKIPQIKSTTKNFHCNIVDYVQFSLRHANNHQLLGMLQENYK